MELKFVVSLILLSSISLFSCNKDDPIPPSDDKINDISNYKVGMSTHDFSYTGSPIDIKEKIVDISYYVEGEKKPIKSLDLNTINISYFNNVEVGVATAYITHPDLKGQNEVKFNINKAKNIVTYDINEAFNLVKTGNYKQVSFLVKDGSYHHAIDAPTDLYIPKDCELYFEGYYLVNKFKTTIDGTLRVGKSSKYSFVNETRINEGAKIIVSSRSDLFILTPNFVNDGEISYDYSTLDVYASIYYDYPVNLNIKKEDMNLIYKRPDARQDLHVNHNKICLYTSSKNVVEYTGEELRPGIKYKYSSTTDVPITNNIATNDGNARIEYLTTDFINVGPQIVKITSTEYSEFLRGETTFEYNIISPKLEITKEMVIAGTADQFMIDHLKNPNYQYFIINTNYSLSTEIIDTFEENYTLELNYSHTLKQNIKGTLIVNKVSFATNIYLSPGVTITGKIINNGTIYAYHNQILTEDISGTGTISYYD